MSNPAATRSRARRASQVVLYFVSNPASGSSAPMMWSAANAWGSCCERQNACETTIATVANMYHVVHLTSVAAYFDDVSAESLTAVVRRSISCTRVPVD